MPSLRLSALASILILSVAAAPPLVAQDAANTTQMTPPPGGAGGPPPGGMGGVTDEELAADTFVGVTESGAALSGLFPVVATGVTTEPLRTAAQTFIDSLTADQQAKSLFAVDDLEWRKWSNVDGYQRQGTSLEEMTDAQKETAWGLLEAALSVQGLEEAQSIMKLNLVEGELLGQTDRFGEELYWFTIMGEPSATEPWGFQLDGHHLIINYFVQGDQVTMTPTFMGSEPAVAPEGTTYAGEEALQAKQNAGLAFMQSLSEEQQAIAVIEPDKTGDDLIAGAFADNATVAFEGIRGDALDEEQKELLFDVVGQWVGDMREEHAEVWLADIEDHIDETYFAWIGDTSDNAVFYFRIYSPVVLIEFDHEKPGPLGQNPDFATDMPTRAHIHSIIRTPNGNDYGKDLLRQHLEQDHRPGSAHLEEHETTAPEASE